MRWIWYFTLLAGIVLEVFIITRGAHICAPLVKPWLFLLANVGIITSVWQLRRYPAPFNSKAINPWLSAFCWLILGYYGMMWMLDLAKANPIDVAASDIIPSIEVYTQRFLRGEQVYKWFAVGTWGYNPTYLPMFWLPFVPAEKLAIDYRVWAFLVWWCALGLHAYRLSMRSAWWVSAVLLFGALQMFRWMILEQSGTMAHTVEWMPAAMYLLLAFFIPTHRAWVLAFGLVCCLLGRYSFLSWLPFAVLMWWQWRKPTFVFSTVLWVLVGVLLIYIIPFLSADWSSFSKGLAGYDAAILGEWTIKSWQGEAAKAPFHQIEGCGFAIYSWFWGPSDVESKIRQTKWLMLGFAALASALFWWRQRATQFSHPALYILMSLKAAIGAFCVFGVIPYIYLYVTALSLTWALLFQWQLGDKTIRFGHVEA